MRNINKDTLVEEYIKNNNIKNEENYYDYEEIVCHKNWKYKLNEFIQYFLKDYLFNDKNWEFNYISYEKLINDIKEFDVSEVAGWEIDEFYNKLICSYKVFDAWLDITEKN